MFNVLMVLYLLFSFQTRHTMAGTHGNNKERQLGVMESVFQLFTTKYFHGIQWHIGIVRSNNPLQASHAATALRLLAHKQESLQMRILPLSSKLKNSTSFKFQPMVDPFRIDFEVISMKNKDDWPNVIRNDHIINRIDTTNGPLWRFILGEVDKKENRKTSLCEHEYVLLLKLHHSIGDGISASDLMCRQFLPILSALVNGRDTENMLPVLPQMKSVEGMFLPTDKLQEPIPWYIRAKLKLLRCKSWIFKQPETPLFKFSDENVSSEEASQCLACVPKVFGQEISESVIKAAKTNCVTVHTVLLVAGAMAFSRTAKAAGIKLPESFQQMWPIDLRKYLDLGTPQPLAYLNTFTSTVHSNNSECDLDAFWESCKNMYLAVRKESDKDKLGSTSGFMKYLLPEIAEHKYVTATKELGMECLIALSNLGNLSKEQEPYLAQESTEIQMTEQFFTMSGFMRVIPMFQFMITFRGKFMWNILYPPERVSRRFIDTYYNNLETILVSYCMQQ